MKGRIVVIGILVILMLSSFAVGFGSGNASGKVVNKISNGGMKGYTSHSVIRINNDTDFANQAASEGWPGNGTESNPYIISGYDIDAHHAGDAIYIGNTTAYFVVENCYLHNASYHSDPYFYGDGIMLYNVKNGKIIGNNITNNNLYGIELDSSSSNTISGNKLTNNDVEGIDLSYSSNNNTISSNTIMNNSADGIDLSYSSNNNTISSNTIMNNSADGIWLYSSSSNTISGNNIMNNNWYGIWLESSSSNNIIRGNTITKNSYYGIYLHSSSSNNIISGNRLIGNSIFLRGNKDTFTTQTIYTNNTVNGKPVYYYKNANMDNASVPLDAGEVICGNVSWLKIEGLDLSNGDVGIELGYSSHITISGNNLTNNNRYGIYLHSSRSNTISMNSIMNNGDEGIYLQDSSSNNIISGNNLTNNGMGIYLYWGCDSNTIHNNLISNNTNHGIYIESSSYNLIYNNLFYYNNGSGDVYSSSHVQAYDDGSNNYWNSFSGIGNYWHEWANNNDTNDQNHDGIVDWPYKIDGPTNAKDYYPFKNTPPLPPRNLKSIAGDGYVNLTWEVPFGNGTSPIMEYKIYRNGALIATVPATQLYYNDTNVVNGQTYTYYVTAVNSVGESEPSNEVQATPGGTIPEFSTGIWMAILIIISLLGVTRFRKPGI